MDGQVHKMNEASTALSAEQEGTEEGRSLRRAAYLTAGVGAAHAVLFLLSYYLLSSTPGPDASDAAIVIFYNSAGRRLVILAGLYVMPFAGIAFMWFIVALRMWISAGGRPENYLLSNMQLVSGILYVAMFFVAAAAHSTVAASTEFSSSQIDPVVARQLPQYANTLLLVLAMRMAAMFVFTTSNIGKMAGVLPRWFVYLGFAVGLFLLLSASFSNLLVLVFPVWLFTLCLLLMWRSRHIPAEAVIGGQLKPETGGGRGAGG
jgi:hypothetical protein